jgi:hypothetical protein
MRAADRPLAGPRLSAARLIAAGAGLGLTWAASLRAYMAALAGFESAVDWAGTFALILLPGAAVGALFGWAEAQGRAGRRRTWVAFVPLVFPVLALAPPDALTAFLATGIGGGSLALVATGMLLGFAASGRGPRWGRVVTGALGLAGLAGSSTAGLFIRSQLSFGTARGLWVAILGVCLTAVFGAACSIPHRAPAIQLAPLTPPAPSGDAPDSWSAAPPEDPPARTTRTDRPS